MKILILFFVFVFTASPSLAAPLNEADGWESFNRPLTEAAIDVLNRKRTIIVNGRETDGEVYVNQFYYSHRSELDLGVRRKAVTPQTLTKHRKQL